MPQATGHWEAQLRSGFCYKGLSEVLFWGDMEPSEPERRDQAFLEECSCSRDTFSNFHLTENLT